MNIKQFLRETAEWESRMFADGYSGDQYSHPLTIGARWHYEARLVRNNEGEEVTCDAHVTTLQRLRVGDRVTDPNGDKRIVQAVRVNRDVNGKLTHYRSSLK